MTLDSGSFATNEGNNPGYAERTFSGTKELKISLNNWGFFKALRNTLFPPANVSVKVQLADDNAVLYEKAAVNRLVVKSIELMLSVVELKPTMAGQISSQVTQEQDLYFFEESIHHYPEQTTIENTNIIPDSFPKYLFYYTTRAEKRQLEDLTLFYL